MKNRNRIYRAAALLMILALLLTGVSGGADGNDSGAPSAVYSGWLRLDELLGGAQPNGMSIEEIFSYEEE